MKAIQVRDRAARRTGSQNGPNRSNRVCGRRCFPSFIFRRAGGSSSGNAGPVCRETTTGTDARRGQRNAGGSRPEAPDPGPQVAEVLLLLLP